MRIIFAPEVNNYLDFLMETLFEKEYFGFQDSAYNYVKELVDDILSNLTTRQHKPASSFFERYGDDLHYASFTKNKRTTWYAFFTKYQDENGDIVYLIRYVANNHTVAQYL